MYTYIYTWKKKVIIKIPRVNESYSKVNVDVATLTLLLLLRKKNIELQKKESPYETRTAVESPCARRPVPEGKKIAEKIDGNPFLDPRYVTRKFISRSRSAKEGVATPVTNPWTRQWAGPPPSPCNAPLSPPLFFFFFVSRRAETKIPLRHDLHPREKNKKEKKRGGEWEGRNEERRRSSKKEREEGRDSWKNSNKLEK